MNFWTRCPKVERRDFHDDDRRRNLLQMMLALGGSYRVNTLDLAEDVQMYDDLLNAMMADDQEESFWSDFQGVKHITINCVSKCDRKEFILKTD